MTKTNKLSRRNFTKSLLALSGAAVTSATPLRFALGAEPLKIGLILPYSGVYANFGEGITNGFDFALKKRGGQIAGRPVQVVKGDDQLDPKVGGEVAQKIVTRDNVDLVVGTVGSNVLPVLQKICTDNNKPLIVPTAAGNDTTRANCHPLVFRVSHSNWQMTSPAGAWLFKRGAKKVMTMGMNYATGKEEVIAFSDEFKKAGGEIVDQKWPGWKELDYQAYFADGLVDEVRGHLTALSSLRVIARTSSAIRRRLSYGFDAAGGAGGRSRRCDHQRPLRAVTRQSCEQKVPCGIQEQYRQGRRHQLHAWSRFTGGDRTGP